MHDGLQFYTVWFSSHFTISRKQSMNTKVSRKIMATDSIDIEVTPT